MPGPITAKTWVRPDGVVLRQEVPFPFVRLVLERHARAPARAPSQAEEPRPMIELGA